MTDHKRYIMPCFVSHNHGLLESAEGYIVQASDYDELLKENARLKNSDLNAENIKLKKEIADLQKQLKAASKKKSSGKKTTKYSVKVPIDEDEWIFVVDH